MNVFKQWDQLKELEALHLGLKSLFSRPSVLGPEAKEGPFAVAEWAPLVDICEDDREYVIKAELPEVRREDVKVTADKGTLTITGERRFAKDDKNVKYHRIERACGNFVRNFSLPDDVSPAKVSAEFKDGVLTLRLAKTVKTKPQQIVVKVA
jgi:HSP20 family protein